MAGAATLATATAMVWRRAGAVETPPVLPDDLRLRTSPDQGPLPWDLPPGVAAANLRPATDWPADAELPAHARRESLVAMDLPDGALLKAEHVADGVEPAALLSETVAGLEARGWRLARTLEPGGSPAGAVLLRGSRTLSLRLRREGGSVRMVATLAEPAGAADE